MESGASRRITVSAIAAAAVLGIIGGAFQTTAGYALRASGGDAWAYRELVAAMNEVARFLTSPLFFILGSAAAGAAISTWSDYIWRRWSDRRRRTRRLSFNHADRKLYAMTLVLIFGCFFVLSTLWLAGERFLVSTPPAKEKPKLGNQDQIQQSAFRAEAEKPSSTPYPNSILTTRYYSKQNKETVADILDRTSGVLSKKGEDIFAMAETAINRSAWDRPNENIQPMIDRMLTIEALTADLRRDLFEELYKQYPDFRIEINNLIFPFEPPANFENGAKNFKNALTVWNEHREGLEGNQRQEFIQLVNTARGAFAGSRQEFLKWATERTTKIDQTRRALRQ